MQRSLFSKKKGTLNEKSTDKQTVTEHELDR